MLLTPSAISLFWAPHPWNEAIPATHPVYGVPCLAGICHWEGALDIVGPNLSMIIGIRAKPKRVLKCSGLQDFAWCQCFLFWRLSSCDLLCDYEATHCLKKQRTQDLWVSLT